QVRETVVPVFLCPSTPGGSARFNQKTVSGVAIRAAPGDYAPNNAYDSALEAAGYVDVAVNRNGVLQVNQSWSIPDILDGTSNTLMISEDGGRPARRAGGKAEQGKGPAGGGRGRPRRRVRRPGFTRGWYVHPRPLPHQLHQQQRGVQLPPRRGQPHPRRRLGALHPRQH